MKNKVYLAGLGNFGKKIGEYLEKMGKNVCVLPKDLAAQTEALKDPEVEALFVVTPNDRHYELLDKALKGGRHHIFVEKPITSSWGDALQLRDLAKANRNILMVGHNQRREAVFRKAKEILDSGRIGKVVSAYFNYSHGAAFNISPDNWRAQIKRHREGPLITLGSHSIDTLHYLLGPVKLVTAFIQNLTGKIEAPDANAVTMLMENGATVFLQADYNIPSEKICLIHGTEGVIGINRDKIHLRIGRDVDRKPSEYEEIPVAHVDTIEEELEEFFAAIEGRATVETGFSEAFNVMAVIDSCFHSDRHRPLLSVADESPGYFS
ncbi:MAG: Gfo/Idh/MocA family oxidoreductase [bacterium]|nr:Gfo/Idh/MocA family oxidoreductase [bacterium]